MEEVRPGPCQARPWQLGFREDFGFSGFCEPDEAELLLQLIISEGCGRLVCNEFESV